MVARTFGMYSLGDIGINAGNYNFSTLATGGTFTASATAAPTLVTLDDTDSQNNIFNDGAPGNFAAAPTLQRLTGNVDGTVFTNVPSNPENEFQVRDSGGNIVGSIFDLHNANSAAFSSLQGYVTTFKILPGETYTVTRISSLVQTNYQDFITCFTADTLIDTADGKRRIQDIELGDKVHSLDHGFQKVKWIGGRSVSCQAEHAPIRIRKGALGNTRDLYVSPLHRMLITDQRAAVLFGEKELLVTAKALVNDYTIVRSPVETVHYYHMLFDKHEVIYAEDCPSESFYLSDLSLSSQDREQRDELMSLFPELCEFDNSSLPTARMALKSHEASVLSTIGQPSLSKPRRHTRLISTADLCCRHDTENSTYHRRCAGNWSCNSYTLSCRRLARRHA